MKHLITTLIALLGFAAISSVQATVYSYEGISPSMTVRHAGSVNDLSLAYDSTSENFSFFVDVKNPFNLATLATHGWLTVAPNETGSTSAAIYLDFDTGDVFVYEQGGVVAAPDQNSHITTYENALSVIQNADGFSVSFNQNVFDVNNHNAVDPNWTGIQLGDFARGAISLVNLKEFETTGNGSDKTISVWSRDGMNVGCLGILCQKSYTYTSTYKFNDETIKSQVQVSEPFGLSILGLSALIYLRRRRMV